MKKYQFFLLYFCFIDYWAAVLKSSVVISYMALYLKWKCMTNKYQYKRKY